MRILLLNHIQNARDSLRSHRMRTVLTILGVAIGIASITTIIALGGGASRIVSGQVDDLGGNLAVVRPVGMPEASSLGGLVQQPHTASTLSEADYMQIRDIDGVEDVAPLMILPGAIEGDVDTTHASVTIATTPEILDVAGLSVRVGQLFDETTRDNTAALGVQTSIDIFGTENSIGKTFTVRGHVFRVIGVLERENNPVNYNGVDFDRAALVNMESGRDINRGAVHIQQINLRMQASEDSEQTVDEVMQVLAAARGGEEDFTVLHGEEIARPAGELFYAISGAIAAIAGISLVVGGIGIMNIMLVNVAERTREIGIRKAVGATSSNIVWQFLIESLIVGVIGGVVGVLLGYGLAFGISLFLIFDPVIMWQAVLLPMGVGAGVGVLFGIYPAIAAARKDPIESLRQGH